jgi:hypothetical protein
MVISKYKSQRILILTCAALKRNQEQEQPQPTRKKKPGNKNEDFYGNNE